MSTITPAAVISIPGTPDWQVMTEDAVWVSNGPKNTMHRIDVKTNEPVAIEVGKRPCSGLAAGFGSVWVPLCGDRPNVENGAKPALARVDVKTNRGRDHPGRVANSEGGIVASPDAVWILTDIKGTLARIDPATNKVAAEITVAPGSVASVFADGAIWISSPEKSVVTRVDAENQRRHRHHRGRSRSTIHHGGRRLRVDAESGRRHRVARGYEDAQTDRQHRMRHPGHRRRTGVRRRSRLGHRLPDSDHPNRRGHQHRNEAVGRRRAEMPSGWPSEPCGYRISENRTYGGLT